MEDPSIPWNSAGLNLLSPEQFLLRHDAPQKSRPYMGNTHTSFASASLECRLRQSTCVFPRNRCLDSQSCIMPQELERAGGGDRPSPGIRRVLPRQAGVRPPVLRLARQWAERRHRSEFTVGETFKEEVPTGFFEAAVRDCWSIGY